MKQSVKGVRKEQRGLLVNYRIGEECVPDHLHCSRGFVSREQWRLYKEIINCTNKGIGEQIHKETLNWIGNKAWKPNAAFG